VIVGVFLLIFDVSIVVDLRLVIIGLIVLILVVSVTVSFRLAIIVLLIFSLGTCWRSIIVINLRLLTSFLNLAVNKFNPELRPNAWHLLIKTFLEELVTLEGLAVASPVISEDEETTSIVFRDE
jgi:hypothetical protein